MLNRLALLGFLLAAGCGDSKPDNSAIQTPVGQRLDPPTAGGPPGGGGKDAPGATSRKR